MTTIPYPPPPLPSSSDASRTTSMITSGIILSSTYQSWGLGRLPELSFEELRLYHQPLDTLPSSDALRTTSMITTGIILSSTYLSWGLGGHPELSFEELRLYRHHQPFDALSSERTAALNTILLHLLPSLIHPIEGDTSTYLSSAPKVCDARFYHAVGSANGAWAWLGGRVDRMWRRRCRLWAGEEARGEFFERVEGGDWERVGGMVRIGTSPHWVCGEWRGCGWKRGKGKGDGGRIVSVKRRDTGALPRAGERFGSVLPSETLLPWGVYLPIRTDPYCVRRGSKLRQEVVLEAGEKLLLESENTHELESEYDEAQDPGLGYLNAGTQATTMTGKAKLEDKHPLRNPRLLILPLRPRPLYFMASVPQPAGA
ncbi:hypothetical protein BDD12DRAFT_838000 [Trichophaea hybrida]|nr:hypothetical protein BDD12DRAFT_838000 [Trichophaea hybrida]